MKCPNCGAEVKRDQKFCEECGTDLSKWKRCPSCGAFLEQEAVFCPECARVEQINKEEQAVSPVQSVEQEKTVSSNENRNTPGLSLGENMPKKKIALILAAIALFLGICFGGYQYHKKQEADKAYAAQCTEVVTQLKEANDEAAKQMANLKDALDYQSKKGIVDGLKKERTKLNKVKSSADKLPNTEERGKNTRLIEELVIKNMNVYDETIALLESYAKDKSTAKLSEAIEGSKALAGRISVPGVPFNESQTFDSWPESIEQYEVQKAHERDVSSAKGALRSYFYAINGHRLLDAYSMYTDSFKTEMPYRKWSAGYRTSLSTKVLEMQGEYVGDGHVKINYQIASQDYHPKGLLEKKFEGVCDMIRIQGRWKINELDSEEVERTIN